MKILSFFRRIFTPGNIALAVLCVLFAALTFSIFGVVRVSGTSMDPTLSDGQFLVGLRVHELQDVSRGDIVTANIEELDNLLVIKRVIAVPGDCVELVAGQLYLNGELQYEPYIYEPMDDVPKNTVAVFTVPDGQYYIMGDNRNVSLDSRAIGCVEKQELDSLIPLRYQVPLTAAIFVLLALLLLVAVSLSSFIDLRWAAHVAAKQAPAESELCPQEGCDPPGNAG